MKSIAFVLAVSLCAAAGAQEESTGDESLQFTLKAKRPPRMGMGMPTAKFTPRDPLELSGRIAKDDALRKALKRPIDYLLDQQRKDGSWKYSSKQMRKTKVAKQSKMLAGTAGATANPVAITSIAALALRAQEPLDPRIGEAVRKARDYVIRRGPDGMRGMGELWAASFAVSFLSTEFAVERDPEERDRIRKAVPGFVQLILEKQHPDSPAVPEGIPSLPRLEEKPGGGWIGITVWNANEAEGVRVANVQASSPARKAKVKIGDIVHSINGEPVRSVADYQRLTIAVKPGTEIVLDVRRPEKKWKPWKKSMMFGAIPRDGGWSYIDTPASACLSATVLNSLRDAEEIGCRVSPTAVRRGARLLQSIRYQDRNGRDTSFAYANEFMRLVPPWDDVRGAIGRLPAIELALLRTGNHRKDGLSRSLRTFVRHRGELDRVLGFPMTHYEKLYGNAPYYHLYGHYYAARAAGACKDKGLRKSVAVAVQEALLKLQDEQGTWADHEAFGRVVGSSIALMALGEVKWLNPDVYRKWY